LTEREKGKNAGWGIDVDENVDENVDEKRAEDTKEGKGDWFSFTRQIFTTVK